jgi:long-chain acyl-CoA synthetase
MQPTRLFDFLELQYTKFPKKDCMGYKENGNWNLYSTEDVKKIVDNLSAGLLALGVSGNSMEVETQDKVGLISKNKPEWLFLDLACQQIGAILCPIYPTTNVSELEFIFNDATIKYAFISEQIIADKLVQIKDKVPTLINSYSFDTVEGFENWQTILDLAKEEHYTKLAEIKASIKPEYCATIIYTSGTTGFPKGVMLSHKNIVTNVINAKKSFPFEDDINGKALSFLPLNHIFERMVSYIYISSGNSIYYAESLETIGENLKEVKPNLFCTVPRLLEKVYEKILAKGNELTGIKKKLFNWAVDLGDQYDSLKPGSLSYRIQLALANKLIFSKWREGLGGNVSCIITGGAACQVRLLRVFTAAKIPIYEGYGPTENSPVITVNRREKGGTKFGTVGPVIEGQEVKLMEDGEICVKGPSVMLGYYKRPELNVETIVDGWLHTGDIGVFEENKLDKNKPYLKITDRKKELFKTSGGKYVAPQPIENKMKESPYIEQMMVVGAEQKFVGAFIVPSFQQLTEWCKEHKIDANEPATMIRNKEVLQLFKDIVERYNTGFNQVEQVKKFELLSTEWTIDSGELTPTLKLKRKVIMEKYKSGFERLYS